MLDLGALDRHLLLVADVLIDASSADAEIAALRLDTVRGGLLDGNELSLGKFLFLPRQPRRDLLAGNDEGDENGEALRASDSLSAEGDIMDGKVDDFPWNGRVLH